MSDSLPLSEAERRLLDKTPDAPRESRVQELQDALAQLPELTPEQPADTQQALEQATLKLELAGLLLDLDQKPEARQQARSTIDALIAHQQFEDAALACQYIYLANEDDSVSAIGQATWLSVTYPVDPHLTANILDHIIDETPDNSDGAAVAAATAHYVADARSKPDEHEELRLFTGSMLARVARRHSNVNTPEEFTAWVQRLELDQPDKFLIRLRNIVDVMVQMDWWFDRDKLSQAIPADHDPE